jgi:hypothetical protein
MSDHSTVLPPEAIIPPPAPNSFFRGPNGIRAGWRVLIFLAIVVGLVAVVNLAVFLVVHFFMHRGLKPFQVASLTPLPPF